jgi:NADH dehydrogenase/NADH:ubiquinone oxidoreductase subunit G
LDYAARSLRKRPLMERLVPFGLALIVCGSALEVVALPLTHALARIGEHRTHIMRLAQARDGARAQARTAAATAADIDETWVHYDLKVQALEAAFDASGTAGEQSRIVRQRIAVRLVATSPLPTLDAVAEPAASDAGFRRARDAFLVVYGEYHRQLVAFAALLNAGIDVSSPIAQQRSQQLRTLSSGVDECWAAISVRARALSDEAARSAASAQTALDGELAMNGVEAIVDP